jgi:DNA polymerase (family 10)/putative hydrolase
MKIWMKYDRYLMNGEWHIHTNYTDGKNSVEDYCKKAAKLGLPLIAFTEHVRRTLTYDFNDLTKEIESARESYPGLIILTGCEAKVLEDGDLDVSEDVKRECDIVLMAFHSFPKDKRKYVSALKRALTYPEVDIWAHPGLFLAKSNFTLTDEEIAEILDIAKKNEVLIEINKKYNLPPTKWCEIGLKNGLKFVKGSDVHSVDDMR